MSGRRDRRIRAVRTALRRWYRRRRRDLPWRRRRDPYAVWVSEIMLQQTRAATVERYYAPFLRRFPDVRILARARRDAVLKAWEGLGYYGRARNLHRAARTVVRERGGRLPRDVDELRRLPGIGACTAGAIASIAFGADEPVLDGNVARVLSRLFAVAGLPRAPQTARRLWKLARELLPPGRAGEFNQALMDLGATVCTPRRPDCPGCPLSSSCAAFARGRPERYPRKRPRKALPHHTIVAGVIWKRGRLLIDRRPDEGLLGGLWEFPGGKVRPGESLIDALRREVSEEVGLTVRPGAKLIAVRHAYSHFRITLHVFECDWLSGRARPIECAAVRWVRPGDLARYAFPAANHKVIAALREARG